jgi:hypothetical protein
VKLADMTNTDGSGCAPSTTPQIQKKRQTLREVAKARRKAADGKPETPWNRGT